MHNHRVEQEIAYWNGMRPLYRGGHEVTGPTCRPLLPRQR